MDEHLKTQQLRTKQASSFRDGTGGGSKQVPAGNRVDTIPGGAGAERARAAGRRVRSEAGPSLRRMLGKNGYRNEDERVPVAQRSGPRCHRVLPKLRPHGPRQHPLYQSGGRLQPPEPEPGRPPSAGGHRRITESKEK